MRIAIVSDIHGNLSALDAVIADLRTVAPDVIFHGGDLSDAGASPVEVIDTIRSLGWQGVAGNTDEALFRPASLIEFAELSPAFAPLLPSIEEQMQWTRAQLGDERLAWLSRLPRTIRREGLALVHASPVDRWRSPNASATDEALASTYASLEAPLVVFGHIHQPFIRSVGSLRIINSGSVGMPFDGDPRASYALIDNHEAEIRRVEYDVQAEVHRIERSAIPHSARLIRTLQTARPQMQ